MNVVVIGWTGTSEPGSGRTARGCVDGVRVTVRRCVDAVTWRCREHGEGINDPNHCEHTAALAAAPADPSKNRPARRTA